MDYLAFRTMEGSCQSSDAVGGIMRASTFTVKPADRESQYFMRLDATVARPHTRDNVDCFDGSRPTSKEVLEGGSLVAIVFRREVVAVPPSINGVHRAAENPALAF